MGTILENHTLHIINEDKTSDKLTGVMIQVNETESVFHVRIEKNCSIPPVIKSVCENCGNAIEQHSIATKLCPDRLAYFKQTVL